MEKTTLNFLPRAEDWSVGIVSLLLLLAPWTRGFSFGFFFVLNLVAGVFFAVSTSLRWDPSLKIHPFEWIWAIIRNLISLLWIVPAFCFSCWMGWMHSISYAAIWLVFHPLIGVVFGTCIGIFVAQIAHQRWKRVFLVMVLFFCFSALTLWDLYHRPNFFFLHPFVGYFPGPIYDEWIPLFSSVLTYRLWNLVMGFSFLAWGLQGRRSLWPKAILAGCFGLLFFRSELLWAPSYQCIQKQLSQSFSGNWITLHFDPAHTSEKEAKNLAMNLEYTAKMLRVSLSLQDASKIQVFLYPDSIAKKRYTGTQWTLFGHPIQKSVHLLSTEPWHWILLHELTHAAASEKGIDWIHTGKSLALTEGLATAMQSSAQRIPPHTRAAIMLKMGKLPSILDIESSLGFLSQNSFRSYYAYGSFCLWLLEHYSIEQFLSFYKNKPFSSEYGMPLTQAQKIWRQYLSSLSTDPILTEKFRPSIQAPNLFEKKAPYLVEHHRYFWDKNVDRGLLAKASKHLHWILEYSEDPYAFVESQLVAHPQTGNLMQSWINEQLKRKNTPPLQKRRLERAWENHQILLGNLPSHARDLADNELENHFRKELLANHRLQDFQSWIKGSLPSIEGFENVSRESQRWMIQHHLFRMLSLSSADELMAWSIHLDRQNLSPSEACQKHLWTARGFEFFDLSKSMHEYEGALENCSEQALQNYLSVQMKRLQEVEKLQVKKIYQN
ncbi:MAG: hypothetical protein R3A11_09225 [Bdellovibrionota bacterium]